MMRLSGSPATIRLIIVAAIVLVAGVAATRTLVDRYNPGPAQPIPFSHHVHADVKGISCFFCHPYASISANAGIPSVEKCLLCHKGIASNFEPIRAISQYYARGKGIPWVRTTVVPDFVRFSHQAHISAGHDCSECHGDVKAMDRIKPVKTINMDFCISCHRKNGASVDCYICHY